jgi:hypothetical protein
MITIPSHTGDNSCRTGSLTNPLLLPQHDAKFFLFLHENENRRFGTEIDAVFTHLREKMIEEIAGISTMRCMNSTNIGGCLQFQQIMVNRRTKQKLLLLPSILHAHVSPTT